MIGNYIKIAIKVLKRRKFFTFVSLFGICFTLTVLNIGTAFFDKVWGSESPESLAGKILLFDRINITTEKINSIGSVNFNFLNQNFRDFKTVDKYSFFTRPKEFVFYKDGKKLGIKMHHVDVGYWQLFDLHFLEGKPFDESHNQSDNKVIISEYLRRQVFGNQPVIGQQIELNRKIYQVIGVVANSSEMNRFTNGNVWAQIPNAIRTSTRRSFTGGYRAAFLPKSIFSFEDVRDEIYNEIGRYVKTTPFVKEIKFKLKNKFELWAEDFYGSSAENSLELSFIIVISATLVFISLPALNLITISSVRLRERYSEIGVRKAFGATSVTLMKQFILENLILTLIGGGIALLCSSVIFAVVNSTDLFSFTTFSLNTTVFLIGLVLAILLSLVSGVYPAYKLSSLNPVIALKGVR